MSLNWDKINDLETQLSKYGDYMVFRANQIDSGSEEYLRLMLPLDNMGGLYYKQVLVFWIAGKPYVSLETFDEECPMMEEYNEAKKSGDSDLKKLMDSDKFRLSKTYMMPALRINEELNSKGESLSVSIIGDEAVIFECGTSVMKPLNRIASNPKRIKQGKGESIFSREFGTNVIVTKTGSGLGTEYGAQADTGIMDLSDEDFDKYYENTPDIVDYLESQRKSPEYLRSVIRNYFYGDEVLDEAEAEDDDAEDSTSKTKAKRGTAKKSKPTKAKKGKKASSLLKDVEKLDEEVADE